MAISPDLSTAAFMRGFRRNPQPPPAPIESTAPTGAPSQLEGFQGSPVVTYYIPDYQGTGPMYVTTGFAGWEWMRPVDYQRRLAAGEIPPATLGGADFDRMYAAYQAQAAQARAATPAIRRQGDGTPAAPAAQAPSPALPPLDIYAPGPFLAALARRESNLPLPRANQLTPLFYRRATPTQLDFMGGLASNRGIDPRDYFQESLRFHPTGEIGPLPRYRA